MTREDALIVVVAKLEEQVKNLVSLFTGTVVPDMKNLNSLLMKQGETLAELTTREQHLQKHMSALEARYDQSLAIATTTEKKVDEWINRARGASWLASVFGASCMAGVVSAIVWLFGSVNETGIQNRLQDQRLMAIEKTVKGGGAQHDFE